MWCFRGQVLSIWSQWCNMCDERWLPFSTVYKLQTTKAANVLIKEGGDRDHFNQTRPDHWWLESLKPYSGVLFLLFKVKSTLWLGSPLPSTFHLGDFMGKAPEGPYVLRGPPSCWIWDGSSCGPFNFNFFCHLVI